jgi:hypothetical protein
VYVRNLERCQRPHLAQRGQPVSFVDERSCWPQWLRVWSQARIAIASRRFFRRSNSIVDLCVVSGREPTREDLSGAALAEVLEILYPEPLFTAKAEVHEDHAIQLEGVVQKLKSGVSTLVVVDCGCGAEIVALCATVDLRGPL